MKKTLVMLLAIFLFACNNEESTDSTDTYRTDSTVIERDNTLNSDTSMNRTDTINRSDTNR